ncbi:hypothetical protein RDI58_007034 [Solanum bulbocastanum]|uniref:Uncharacterized protein n=1 Tax=Solanum bulbocastanum TaxID=147425 RepID=A0AAN8U095_SOLBU
MWSLASEFQTKVKESWQERSEGRHMFGVVGLLGSKNHNRKHVCSAIIQNGNLVTQTQREGLTKEFTKEEVKQALWEMVINHQDLMGEFGSIKLMPQGLLTFSEASVLTTNAGKSNIFSANMERRCLEDMCDHWVCKRIIAFKILGGPHFI